MATVPGTADKSEAGQVQRLPVIRRYRSKRALDVVAASIGLLVAAPLAAIIALLIKLSSPGPVLFKQERIGKDGKPFMFYKFRSMSVGNDDSQHRQYIKLFIEGKEEELRKLQGGKKLYKMTCDDRVTTIGKFLRRTSLDELPQLLNVLKGEMSMVGPRPHLAYEVELYKDWHRRRLQGLPGITGWWQIHSRGDSPLQYLHSDEDLYYVQNYSLWLDIQILWKTLAVVLRGKGAY